MVQGRRAGSRRRLIPLLIAMMGCAALALPGCGQTTDPALASGWRWYHDTQFPFEVPVPPGWRANAYLSEFRSGDQCGRSVDLIPPVSESLYAESPPGGREPEIIAVFVAIKCPGWAPVDNRGLAAHSEPIMISGRQATLYDGQPDDADVGIARLAVARFGKHQYVFKFEYDVRATTPWNQAQANLALYMYVLQKFTYTGK